MLRKPAKSRHDLAAEKFRKSLLFRPKPLLKPRRVKPLAGQLPLFDEDEERTATGGHYAERDL